MGYEMIFYIAILALLIVLLARGWSAGRVSAVALFFEVTCQALADGKITTDEYNEITALVAKIFKGDE